MAGNCAIFRSWNTGDSLTAGDLTNSFTTVGVTNATPQCLDDYSTNATQMQSTVDPYPAASESLATATSGELERLRYVIKKITGFSQWYKHTENFTFPNAFSFSSVGPHAIGVAINANTQLNIGGAFVGAGSTQLGVRVQTTLSPAANQDAYGLFVTPGITEAGSGTHGLLAGMVIGPGFTDGAAVATNTASMDIPTYTAPTGTVNASGLKIEAAPTGATNNYALWIAGGNIRHVGNIGRLANTDLGPSLYMGDDTLLLFRSGTSHIQWNNQANTFERMRLTDAGSWTLSVVGPHAIGGATDPDHQVLIRGSFTPTTDFNSALRIQTSLQGLVGKNTYGLDLAPVITEASSGTHAILAGAIVRPAFSGTAGAGTTDAAGLVVDSFAAPGGAAGTTNAAGIKILGVPTGATNNYGFWNTTTSRFDNAIGLFGGSESSQTIVALSGAGINSQTGASIAFGGNVQRMRLTDAGVLTLRTIISTSALDGEIVLDNSRGIRGLNVGATDTLELLRLGASNNVQIGRGTVPAIEIGTVGNATGGAAGDLIMGHNKWSRGTNAASSSTVPMWKINTSDFLEFGASIQDNAGLFVEFLEQTDPAAPAANRGRLYVKDNGSGKTQLVMRFNTGVVQVIATEP